MGAPPLRAAFAPIAPVYERHLEADAERAELRLGALGDNDAALASYERAYARGVAALRPLEPADSFALAPYPASVRTRNLAIAIRRGRVELREALAQSARSVLLQLEWHLLANHLHENAIALVCAGLVATGPEADVWYAVGSRLLTREIAAQWLPDGGHFERSATYHGWLVASLLELIELHHATSRPVPEAWLRCLERALSWIERVRTPDDSWPLLNDSSLDFCPPPVRLLELARELGLHATPHASSSLDVLRDTGWVVARAGRAWVVADVGEIGPQVQAGHGHADPLTFELWVGEARTIVDAGVRQYGVGPGRDWCRSSAVHNTVAIDGADSAEVWHGFRVGRRPRVTLVSAECSTSPRWVAEHDGYAHLRGSPRHRREWVLTPSSLTIHDEVRGSGEHLVMATLRVDEAAAEAASLSITSDARALPELGGKWYPRHGEAHSARCFTFGDVATLPWSSTLRVTFAP